MPVGDFKALVLEQTDGKVSAAIQTLSGEQLPEGDVTVAVTHSALNYKDGLILKGLGGLVRNYPHVPGIDFAGTVLESQSSKFKPGDAVLLTGWRVGEAQWGGYAECARVRSEWLLKLPKKLNAFHVMALGTAGLTAMLAVMALEADGVTPNSGEVLVTGANGALGSIAIALLAHAGFKVVAATGRTDAAERLRALGAAEVIGRAELVTPARPLLSARWAGCVDAVGGAALPAVLAGTK
jgi:acrylyl-CoA reductase (NADPH)